jgi:RNA polymerase sigma factor FliA
MPEARSTLETLETAAGSLHQETSPQRLIEGCQGLVRSLAWKIQRKLPPSVELDDLVAFGQVGLVEAARGFDPRRGGKFITYAYYRIRGAIFDGLAKMSWFHPRDYHASRYERMADEVLQLTGGDGEGSPPASLEDDLRGLRDVTGSLLVVYLASTGRGEDGERSLDLADESTPGPSARVMEEEIREKLRQLIDALPADAGALIRAVYYEGATLKDAGAQLGISKAWASRLHAKTLRRLARALLLIGYGEEGGSRHD